MTELIQSEIVIENEPSAGTILHTEHAFGLIHQPALLQGVGEGLVALHLDLGIDDAVINIGEEFTGEIGASVDPSVVGDELVKGHLGLDLRVVGISIEHDDGVGKHEHRILVGKHTGWILREELASERFHDSLDLLRFTREPKGMEESSKGPVDLKTAEIDEFDEGVEHLNCEIFSFTEIIAQLFFVEVGALLEKGGDVMRGGAYELVCDQRSNRLLGGSFRSIESSEDFNELRVRLEKIELVFGHREGGVRF